MRDSRAHSWAPPSPCGRSAPARLLRRSPVMLPISGTSRVSHVEENVRAARVASDDTGFQTLSRAL
ncbi:hypothetical protein [Streptomyces fagopyri]|uniref:hypothetical protein n=1 Tax=Streptomyces fagopyri TaxID=2662397 RepID=UPI0037F38559